MFVKIFVFASSVLFLSDIVFSSCIPKLSQAIITNHEVIAPKPCPCMSSSLQSVCEDIDLYIPKSSRRRGNSCNEDLMNVLQYLMSKGLSQPRVNVEAMKIIDHSERAMQEIEKNILRQRQCYEAQMVNNLENVLQNHNIASVVSSIVSSVNQLEVPLANSLPLSLPCDYCSRASALQYLPSSYATPNQICSCNKPCAAPVVSSVSNLGYYQSISPYASLTPCQGSCQCPSVSTCKCPSVTTCQCPSVTTCQSPSVTSYPQSVTAGQYQSVSLPTCQCPSVTTYQSATIPNCQCSTLPQYAYPTSYPNVVPYQEITAIPSQYPSGFFPITSTSECEKCLQCGCKMPVNLPIPVTEKDFGCTCTNSVNVPKLDTCRNFDRKAMTHKCSNVECANNKLTYTNSDSLCNCGESKLPRDIFSKTSPCSYDLVPKTPCNICNSQTPKCAPPVPNTFEKFDTSSIMPPSKCIHKVPTPPSPNINDFHIPNTYPVPNIVQNVAPVNCVPNMPPVNIAPNIPPVNIGPNIPPVNIASNLAPINCIENVAPVNCLPNVTPVNYIQNMPPVIVAPYSASVNCIPNLPTVNILPSLSTPVLASQPIHASLNYPLCYPNQCSCGKTDCLSPKLPEIPDFISLWGNRIYDSETLPNINECKCDYQNSLPIPEIPNYMSIFGNNAIQNCQCSPGYEVSTTDPLKTIVPVPPSLPCDDDAVAIIYKPKSITLFDCYGSFLKEVTMKVLVPLYATKLYGL